MHVWCVDCRLVGDYIAERGFSRMTVGGKCELKKESHVIKQRSSTSELESRLHSNAVSSKPEGLQ